MCSILSLQYSIVIADHLPSWDVHCRRPLNSRRMWRNSFPSVPLWPGVLFRISGQWAVGRGHRTGPWEQQHGGGKRSALLHLSKARHQLLHDVSSQFNSVQIYSINDSTVNNPTWFKNGSNVFLFFVFFKETSDAVCTWKRKLMLWHSCLQRLRQLQRVVPRPLHQHHGEDGQGHPGVVLHELQRSALFVFCCCSFLL